MASDKVPRRSVQGHAVVLGGSIAGLTSACVLARRFDRVTLVERDRLPDSDDLRRGVPQSRHTHNLLAGGAATLERVVPGLADTLVAAGAQASEPLDGCPDSHCRAIAATRPLLEARVRRHVRGLANVTVLDARKASGLVTDGPRGRIIGVLVKDGEATVPLGADLVVDATGRGSRSLAWLRDHDHPVPAEDRVTVGLRYTTRLYSRAATDAGGWGFIHAPARPPNRRMGIALAVENNRWIVTLGGLLGEHAPTDHAGFATYAAALPKPQIAELIRTCEPLGEAATTRFPAHTRRRFERLRRPAAGFVVLGDALCSFSPVYGQGMTVAAQEAWLLGVCLDAGGVDGLPRRFYRAVAPVLDVPWQIAAGNDLRFAAVKGPRPLRLRLLQTYLTHLRAAAHDDEEVARAFTRVLHLVDPLRALLMPRIVGRVAAGQLRHRRATVVLGPPRRQPRPATPKQG